MRLRSACALFGSCLLVWIGLSASVVPAAASQVTQARPGQPTVVELREPLSVSDAVRLISSMGAQPAEFVARYRVGGQLSTAGYTVDAARQPVSVASVTRGLRTAVAAAIAKIRENGRLDGATRAQWVRDQTAAVDALDQSAPLIQKVKVLASGTATQRLRAQKAVGSVTPVPVATAERSAASRATEAAATATAGGVPWWPYTGYIQTTCCWEAGNRGVYQSMVWTEARLNALKNARGDPSNVAYEADAIYYNGDGSTYLQDTISWTTNLPDAYLDTQLSDPQEFKARTIGTADASQISLNSANPVDGSSEANYYTLIVSQDGGGATDTATVKGTVSHRSPSFCHEPACIFSQDDIPSHYFIPNQGHQVPGLTPFPCEAAVPGYCDPALNGPPVVLSIELGGQQRSFPFQGSAGDRINLGLTDNSFAEPLGISVLKPDGTSLDSVTLTGAHGDLDPPKLPTTGTYRVRLTPRAGDLGWLTVTLSSAVTGATTVDGAATSVTIPRIGQDAYIQFQGTIGQQLSLGLTGNTIPGYMNLNVYRPDGANLAAHIPGGTNDQLDLPKLPATGTYQIRLDPRINNPTVGTGTVTLTLSTVVTGSMAVDGASTTVTIARPAQDAYVEFQGTAGQQLVLVLSSNTVAGYINVNIYKPDGTNFAAHIAGGTDELDTSALPTTGIYRIRLDPRVGSSTVGTGSVTLTLSTVVTGSISVGSSTTVTTTRPGQDVYLDFQGTTGQLLRLGLSLNSMADRIRVNVYNPNGSSLKGGQILFNGTMDLPALPASGTYRIRLNPDLFPNLGQGSALVSLSTR